MAKFKVYYTIELNEVATHIFESNDFEVKLCSHNDEETYVKELAEFQPDAIMCRTEPITAKMMDTCKNLKVIGKQGAGLDNIDMDHAHAKDITVDAHVRQAFHLCRPSVPQRQLPCPHGHGAHL